MAQRTEAVARGAVLMQPATLQLIVAGELPKGVTVEGGGTTVKEGVTKCAGKDGELVVAHWKDAANAAGTKPDKIFRKDFGDIRFTEDLGAYTLAYVPKGSTDIDAPSSAADIESLGAADAGGTPTSGALSAHSGQRRRLTIDSVRSSFIAAQASGCEIACQ